MIFIPKPGPKDSRPISLSNSLLKIFEKLIQQRLEWWCKSLGLLPSFQYSFRKSRSTVDSLSVLSSSINIVFSKGSKVGALFLDVMPLIMFNL